MEFIENLYKYNFNTFDEWFHLLKNNEEVYPRIRIPFDEWLDEYIETIEEKTDLEVKELLRYLLTPFTRAIDEADYETMCILLERSKNLRSEKREEYIKMFEQTMNIEKNRRIENGQLAWEGLTWVLQYLPFRPYKAIKALNNYLDAEDMYIPDDRIIGINQCIEIIEAKFVYKNKGLENYILKLKPYEFEILINKLYESLGYETDLTTQTRDGGKDIVAQIEREDCKERIYVECKLYKTSKLTCETVRAFGYTINKDNINRGVLFCTGYVSEKLKEIDSRIQIWTLEEIIILLNAHMGSNWFERLDNIIKC